MANLTDEDVRHIAKLARLKLSDAEVKKFAKDMTSILEYIEILNELNTDDVEPTAQVAGLTNTFRDDSVKPSEASKEDLLECSPLPIVNDQIEALSAHTRTT